MSFGLDKYAKVTFKRGKLTRTTWVVFDQNTMIKGTKQKELHKYLDVDESNRIQHKAMKGKIRKECYWKVTSSKSLWWQTLYSQKRRRKGNDTTWIELQNINYWSTQIPYNINRLDATNRYRTWQKSLLYK